MDSTTESVLICRLATDDDAPGVPSGIGSCSECGRTVWVANSSPTGSRILCIPCATKGLDSDAKFEGLTPEQKAEITEAGMDVSPADLDDIPELCVLIERLCNNLRELRRDKPEEFFDLPIEKLYERLEAAVSSFYRSQVSKKREEASNGPRAS